MIRAFHDPSEPVGICSDCGEIIRPSEYLCPECQAESADPLDLDPVAIAVLIICTLGAGILAPLTWNLFEIWRGR